MSSGKDGLVGDLCLDNRNKLPRRAQYRYLATSIEGFVKQLVLLLSNGYYFYVSGFVKVPNDPAAVDEKLLAKYGIRMSKWERSRRKKTGEAGVQYLRLDRRFILIATHGRHRIFADEAGNLRDIREVAFQFWGYSISYRGGHPHVRICDSDFKELREQLERAALVRQKGWLEKRLYWVAYEPYAPVRGQMFILLRMVNGMRKVASLPTLDWRASIRFRKLPVKVFEPRPGSCGLPSALSAPDLSDTTCELADSHLDQRPELPQAG